MELPQRFAPALQWCASQLSPDRFARLCDSACRTVAAADDADAGESAAQADAAVEPSDPLEKEASAVLCALLTEAVGRRAPQRALLDAVEELGGLTGEHLVALADSLRAAWPTLERRAVELSPGRLPHVVDTEWRLDYGLRSSSAAEEQQQQQRRQAAAASAGQFQVALVLDGQHSPVRFGCTAHQLQDLLAQAREALRAVEATAAAAAVADPR